jgi:hypothetical protein
MGYRGSKSVYIKYTVKEQRVDGSCFGLPPKLRCTLMGGEIRYPVKIPSNQINNIKYYSSNSYSTPTKGRVPTTFAITPLDPYFVSGFSDAEASFIILILK